jgi:hypothetical protein
MPKLINGPNVIDAALFETMQRQGVEAVMVQPIFAPPGPHC